MKIRALFPLLSLAITFSGGAQAVSVNFQGTLVEAMPCSINNDQAIELDFGDAVIIRNLDGQRYSQPLNYELDCGVGSISTVRLSLNGSPTQFDGAAVQTDITGLGIRVNQGGQPFTLNTPLVINPASPPELVAVPVADPGQAPSPGVFSATATLLAEYQ